MSDMNPTVRNRTKYAYDGFYNSTDSAKLQDESFRGIDDVDIAASNLSQLHNNPARKQISSYETSEEQMAQLERRLKDVTKMNTKWQRYDKEREEVVIDLTQKCRRSEERVKKQERQINQQRERIEELEDQWADSRARTAKRTGDLDRSERELYARIESLEVRLKQSEAEKQDARIALEELMVKQIDLCDGKTEKKRCEEKDREMMSMSKRVVDLKDKVRYLERQLSTKQKEMEGQVDLYTQQISICLDDFKQEKREKEDIKKQNEDLRKKLNEKEDLASALKVKVMEYENERRRTRQVRQDPIDRYFDEFCDEQPSFPPWYDRSFSLPAEVVQDNAPYDEVDGGGAHSLHARGAGPAPDQDPLQYDDRSVLGQLSKTNPPRHRPQVSDLRFEDDLLLH